MKVTTEVNDREVAHQEGKELKYSPCESVARICAGKLSKKRKENFSRYLYYLVGTYELPYGKTFSIGKDQSVTLCKIKENIPYVAINQSICITGPEPILVSDSFSPCVPVIAVSRKKTTTALAHCNGLTIVEDLVAQWKDFGFKRIMVISKSNNQRQSLIANDIAEKFSQEGFNTKIFTAPIAEMMAVIVINSIVVAYKQLLEQNNAI